MIKIYKIYTVFFFLLMINSNAQKTIFINDNMFVMLNFKSKIEFNKVSASTEEMLGIKSEDDNLFLQSLVDDLPNSNITIKTEDGRYYSLILEYKKDIPNNLLNQFIDLKDAINNESIIENEKVEEPKKDNKIISTTNKNDSKKDLKNNTNLSIIDKVFLENGFIKSRNGFENQKIRLELKGVYINNDKLYFLLGLRNKSNITYNIQSYLFSIVNKKSKKNISEQVVNLEPINSKNKINTLGVNDEQNIVFEFDKFTIDEKKIFKIEIFEEKGERSLEFNVTSDIITQARIIK